MPISGKRTLSARTRILAWIMLILTIAVTVIVVVTARSLLARVDTQAATELVHETQKLRNFSASSSSRQSDIRSVDDLLTSFLTRNLPESSETYFTIVDGAPRRRSVRQPLARLDRDRAFVSRVADTPRPTSGRVTTAAGPAVYAVIPVRVVGDDSTGELVVVEFLSPEYDQAWTTIVTMSVVSAAALLLAGFAGWIVAGRVLAPIRDVRETAARISESDLDRRIDVRGHDDVARLASTFNRMLDRLESAFDGQRRFLDDAGHELRTPITIIRGHLELMGDDPDERAQTLHLVEDEVERMSRIVDDLIVLARSERPDFLNVSDVDITDLTIDSLAKASALAERNWTLAESADRTLCGDRQRLTQALVQLASNAAQHTAAGDTIEIGSRAVGDRIRLWIRDTGAGIEPENHERIFERFARGFHKDTHHGGGLGLAIVKSIAEAHSGVVSVESAPGSGATFTIDLPQQRPDEEHL